MLTLNFSIYLWPNDVWRSVLKLNLFNPDVFRRNILLATKVHYEKNAVLGTSNFFFYIFSIQFQHEQRTYAQFYTEYTSKLKLQTADMSFREGRTHLE